ncbi:MAG TPA: hypothetical protein VKT73_15215 [Xanthobacteraceae bacterium]|nr:hypothetical protein [Xanthobacteraceae bacterium]
MKKHIAALALSTSILLAASAAEAKKVVVIRGIFGNIVSPMTEIVTGLQKRGHQVTVREWWMGVPEPGFDVAVVHSAGDVPGLMSRAKQVITIDPTFINPGCQPGSKCTNYYAPIDKMPFLVCCGGYAVAGATNKKVPGTPSFFLFAPGHIAMPANQAPAVINTVNGG